MVKVFINVNNEIKIPTTDSDEKFLNKVNSIENFDEKFEELTKGISTLVMGKNTFDYVNQANMWPYPNFETYVVSSEVFSTEDVKQIDIDMTPAMIEFASEKGVWVYGGKKLINFLIDKDLVDEIVLCVLDCELPTGTSLFDNNELDRKFELKDEEVIEDMKLLTYKKA